MTLNNALFTSTNPYWETPPELYNYLDSLYTFDFDPCPVNPTFDGLTATWGKCNYVNPPYGKTISAWLERAYNESLDGNKSVLLIPARTDTKWWHDYVMKSTHVWLIKGRIKFVGAKNSAPFPSAIVVFEGWRERHPVFRTFDYKRHIHGKVIR